MTILITQMSFLLLLFLSMFTVHKTMSTNDHRMVSCNERDREILLIFKEGIIDSYGRISTWTTENNCCFWEGVHCNNNTGRVTRLELPSIFKDGHSIYLKGEMNLSILKLEFLGHLDLSSNDFDRISIPSNHQNITHVSKLLYLDLSWNNFHYRKKVFIHMDNLDWLSPLSSLKYLNLTGNDLHRESNWLHAVAMFPSLLELQLRECKLNNFILNPSLEYMNLSSLITLDLSYNNFASHLPGKFFNLTTHITYLDLSNSNIQGEIPSNILNLESLRVLDLYDNHLKGSIPYEIGQLAYIQRLGLSTNMLSGFIPPTLGNLSFLRYLDLSYNNLSGDISKTTFSKLNSLDSLDLSSSNVTFQFDSDWVPPFQLSNLYLSDSNQHPNFPSWIYTQKSLETLDLSSSGISLVDRNKFVSLLETIQYSILLSNNSMTGDLSNLTLKGYDINLDHNNFTGGLPNISPRAKYVDFSYNSFSGPIPHSWKKLKDLVYINLWSNKLSGEVLVHLSQSTQLKFMNLGENEFSRIISINMSQELEVIILRGNQFEGNIPSQLFNLPKLFHLDLAHNKLSGSMPNCIYNLTHMITNNKQLTSWYVATIDLFQKGQDYMYSVHPDRRTIDLSVNSFSGKVPKQLFRLVQVQTLNLSHNNFTGTIPKIIGGMKNIESFDLSNNMFYGEIPQSMTVLNFLDYLNLSHNNFNGKIPTGTQLQSFDASSYFGNPNLCGAPLSNCTTEEENPKNVMPTRRNEDEDSIRQSLYLGMGVGFAVGFWGICGSLFLLKKWRHAYYRFVDGVGDKIYVTFMVMLNSFKRN
ncbi:receptor-like protein EIX2 [Vicia villosa]|uniref:receptor-like protein EIX2 n=1 Tax=Vicia villosa TaxID=3911 RepID=UPI00273BD8AC|nr:receptor-like protein EIX2 [Vicia villosa]